MMFSCNYLSFLVVISLTVQEATSNHLSQVGNRAHNAFTSDNKKTSISPRKPFPTSSSGTSRGSSNNWSVSSQRGSSSFPRRTHFRTGNVQVTNNNVNNNINSGQSRSGRRTPFFTQRQQQQSPISFSVNELIHQQLITRRVLLNLLRRQLFDANGRYTKDSNARGAGFNDPRSMLRPHPSLPNFHFNQKTNSPGSLVIESTGAISVTEIKTPNGETQIVIDATAKRNKNKSKSIPAEDPPEVEKSAG